MLVLEFYYCGLEGVTLDLVDGVPSGEALGGRAAGEAPRIVLFVGPLLGRVQIVGGPVEKTTVAGRENLRAAFGRPDPSLTRAVEARHANGGEQGNDLSALEPRGEGFTAEGGAVVALENQRRTVNTYQSFEHEQGLLGSGIRDRCPGELHSTGEIAHGQDLRVTAVDGAGRFAMVDGPDRPGLSPVQGLDDLPMLGLELTAIISLEIFQDAAGRLRAAGLKRGQPQTWPAFFQEYSYRRLLIVRGLAAGAAAERSRQVFSCAAPPPGGQRAWGQTQAAGRLPAGGSMLGSEPDSRPARLLFLLPPQLLPLSVLGAARRDAPLCRRYYFCFLRCSCRSSFCRCFRSFVFLSAADSGEATTCGIVCASSARTRCAANSRSSSTT